MSEIRVTGLADLQKLLDELPKKMEQNIMRGALRAGLKPVLEEAKKNLSSNNSNVTNQLKDGMRISAQRLRDGKVTAQIKTKGKHGFVANWVEFGTTPHTITAKNMKALSIGGHLFQSIDHPGARAKPFMRPALDSQAQAAVLASAEYIKKRLTKHGLDTADIEIEAET